MEINYNELKKICLDFFRLAGMEFSLWDENKKNIFSYPDTHSPLCKAVRMNRELYLKCLNCDMAGLETVQKTKHPNVYCCHMGLTEAIVPILQDEEIVGYLMLGQIAEEENLEAIRACINDSVKDESVRRNLEERLNETVSCSHEKVEYCMNILKILIDYMNLSYVIQKSGDNVYYLARKCIYDNISKPLLPKDICRHIGVSTNTLYKIVEKNAEINPTALIRRIKIDEAKKQLEKSTSGLSEIAEAVGIPDVNYFIRVFKRETGISPLRYRKLKKETDENDN